MKRIAFAFILLFIPGIAAAKTGCMDNSQHLKQKFDTKNWHYVACACPCDSYQAKGFYSKKKNECLQCRHRHAARPILFIDKIAQTKQNGTPLPESPRVTMQRLIAQWKRGPQK